MQTKPSGPDDVFPPSETTDPEGMKLRETAAEGLTVRVEHRGSTAIVFLSGELDLRSTAMLSEKLENVEAEGPAVVVLDLRHLRFLDSTGVALTIRAHKRAHEHGRRLVIVPGPARVQKPFELAGLDSILEFREDAAERDPTNTPSS